MVMFLAVGSEIYAIGRCERFNCPCLRDMLPQEIVERDEHPVLLRPAPHPLVARMPPREDFHFPASFVHPFQRPVKPSTFKVPCSVAGLKVPRGGSLADQNPHIHLATNRLAYGPNSRFDYTIGFRCARSL